MRRKATAGSRREKSNRLTAASRCWRRGSCIRTNTISPDCGGILHERCLRRMCHRTGITLLTQALDITNSARWTTDSWSRYGIEPTPTPMLVFPLWLLVAARQALLFSPEPYLRCQGVQHVAVWRSRERVPHAVETTSQVRTCSQTRSKCRD